MTQLGQPEEVAAVHLGPAGRHPTHAWGAILPDESSISRRPDDLVRGDGHSVELTKARNHSWKPQDPVGHLQAH